MAEINTQSVLFTASGLLSAQKGPNGAGFPVNTAPNRPHRYRIQGIKVLKTGAAGSVEVFDATSSQVAPSDSVYSADGNDIATNLGINLISGDILVNITGGFKVYLYLDLNN